jgi:hypothetical protein
MQRPFFEALFCSARVGKKTSPTMRCKIERALQAQTPNQHMHTFNKIK